MTETSGANIDFILTAEALNVSIGGQFRLSFSVHDVSGRHIPLGQIAQTGSTLQGRTQWIDYTRVNRRKDLIVSDLVISLSKGILTTFLSSIPL